MGLRGVMPLDPLRERLARYCTDAENMYDKVPALQNRFEREDWISLCLDYWLKLDDEAKLKDKGLGDRL